MQEIDQRILLHTNPNRLTICWLSVSAIGLAGAVLCVFWYSSMIEARADRADTKAAVAKTEAVSAKREAVTVKKTVGYLHDVAKSNKERLRKLESK